MPKLIRIFFSIVVFVILSNNYLILAQGEQGIDEAIFALKSKNYEKAILIYSDLIANYDSYAPAYYGRALAHYNLGENSKAHSDFENAIKLNKNYSEAYYGIGLVNLQEGKNTLAISNLTKALEINPRDDGIFYARGLAYYLNSNYNSAEKDFTSAIEKNPNNALAYYGRGITNYQMKNFDGAKLDFNYFIMKFGDFGELRAECERLLQVIAATK